MSEALALHAVAALAAGLGAVCRLLLDGAVNERIARREAPSTLPWGVIAVNLSGSLLIGVAAGLLALLSIDGGTGSLSPAAGSWPFVASFGFLGGYTTFSTASYQTVRLAQAGRWGAALLNGLGQLVVAAAGVGVGWGAASGVVWLLGR